MASWSLIFMILRSMRRTTKILSQPRNAANTRSPGTGRDGGIGRRDGLKIHCLYRRAGSSPAPGTQHDGSPDERTRWRIQDMIAGLGRTVAYAFQSHDVFIVTPMADLGMLLPTSEPIWAEPDPTTPTLVWNFDPGIGGGLALVAAGSVARRRVFRIQIPADIPRRKPEAGISRHRIDNHREDPSARS